MFGATLLPPPLRKAYNSMKDEPDAHRLKTNTTPVGGIPKPTLRAALHRDDVSAQLVIRGANHGGVANVPIAQADYVQFLLPDGYKTRKALRLERRRINTHQPALAGGEIICTAPSPRAAHLPTYHLISTYRFAP